MILAVCSLHADAATRRTSARARTAKTAVRSKSTKSAKTKAQKAAERRPVTHLPVDHLPVMQGPDGRDYVIAEGDTVYLFTPPDQRRGALTERDYVEVGHELGVEPAAIKAIVDIEAGKAHQGFWKEGQPIINFDLGVFRKMAARNKVNLGKYARSHSVVFARPDARKYGSQQAAQQARLDAALSIDSLSAIQGTFWGMFQLGGFNWKKCGAASPGEFMRLMKRSERDQLELFAEFVVNSGLLPALRRKDWRTFAKGYNGPSYAAKGYHTRLAAAYAKHKKA